jgi:hypothetical protein
LQLVCCFAGKAILPFIKQPHNPQKTHLYETFERQKDVRVLCDDNHASGIKIHVTQECGNSVKPGEGRCADCKQADVLIW